jgi:hypothetical protein
MPGQIVSGRSAPCLNSTYTGETDPGYSNRYLRNGSSARPAAATQVKRGHTRASSLCQTDACYTGAMSVRPLTLLLCMVVVSACQSSKEIAEHQAGEGDKNCRSIGFSFRTLDDANCRLLLAQLREAEEAGYDITPYQSPRRYKVRTRFAKTRIEEPRRKKPMLTQMALVTPPQPVPAAGSARVCDGRLVPVVNVPWNDAKAYTGWLPKRTGRSYRLLSEAEREYVARVGTATPFWWGSTISTDQANYDGNHTYGDGVKGERRNVILPVASFKPNTWGLYQVHRNVYDWVEDCFHDSYQGAPSDGTAWTEGECRFGISEPGAAASARPW